MTASNANFSTTGYKSLATTNQITSLGDLQGAHVKLYDTIPEYMEQDIDVELKTGIVSFHTVRSSPLANNDTSLQFRFKTQGAVKLRNMLLTATVNYDIDLSKTLFPSSISQVPMALLFVLFENVRLWVNDQEIDATTTYEQKMQILSTIKQCEYTENVLGTLGLQCLVNQTKDTELPKGRPGVPTEKFDKFFGGAYNDNENVVNLPIWLFFSSLNCDSVFPPGTDIKIEFIKQQEYAGQTLLSDNIRAEGTETTYIKLPTQENLSKLIGPNPVMYYESVITDDAGRQSIANITQNGSKFKTFKYEFDIYDIFDGSTKNFNIVLPEENNFPNEIFIFISKKNDDGNIWYINSDTPMVGANGFGTGYQIQRVSLTLDGLILLDYTMEHKQDKMDRLSLPVLTHQDFFRLNKERFIDNCGSTDINFQPIQSQKYGRPLRLLPSNTYNVNSFSLPSNIGTIGINLNATDLNGNAIPNDFTLTVMSKNSTSNRVWAGNMTQVIYPNIETGDKTYSDGDYESKRFVQTLN